MIAGNDFGDSSSGKNKSAAAVCPGNVMIVRLTMGFSPGPDDRLRRRESTTFLSSALPHFSPARRQIFSIVLMLAWPN